MSHLSHNVGVKEMPASGQLLGHLFDQHTLLVNNYLRTGRTTCYGRTAFHGISRIHCATRLWGPSGDYKQDGHCSE